MDFTQNALTQLTQRGYTIVSNETRTLHIAYHPGELLTDPLMDCMAQVNQISHYAENGFDFFRAPTQYISVATLRDNHKANPSAQTEIDKLEHVIRKLICEEKLPALFTSLPYTKSGKFAKSKYITLYSTNLKETYNGEYFAQSQVSLQLQPVSRHPAQQSWMPENLNTILILTISATAKPSKRADDFVDDEGDCKQTASSAHPAKATYLTPASLVPGTSYLDKDGKEYLYLGHLTMSYKSYEPDGSAVLNSVYPCQYYSKITKKTKKDCSSVSTLLDFLKLKFLESKTGIFDKGMTYSDSKRFVSAGSVYFPAPGNRFNPTNLHITNAGGYVFDINVIQK